MLLLAYGFAFGKSLFDIKTQQISTENGMKWNKGEGKFSYFAYIVVIVSMLETRKLLTLCILCATNGRQVSSLSILNAEHLIDLLLLTCAQYYQ